MHWSLGVQTNVNAEAQHFVCIELAAVISHSAVTVT